jgi:hypothetical protein
MSLPLVLLLNFFSCFSVVQSYTSPHINRQAMAGVWRLVGKSNLPKTVQYPMKEFTTYPKKPAPSAEEYLLMLKEDGSFQQYDEGRKKRSEIMANMRGTWDYRDGKLILAADRDDSSNKQVHDTMLVGEVVVKAKESLMDTPNLDQSEQDSAKQGTSMELHLSVPKGAVKIGKFMYPKKHKMFFEQLMFKPLSMGSFELKQVLGKWNAVVQKEESKLLERFRKSDFSGKKFLLTNYPMPERKRKGDLRWSIKYNKFVEDPIKTQKDVAKQENQTAQIRVMEVKLFENNTFSTTAGLGESTVLRGKWWIIGEERDQFWLQVWRFGFGRSVSGSTFSEGRMLSHDDAKSYWGRISYIDESSEEDTEDDSNSVESKSGKSSDGNIPRRLQVKGTVIVGWGLEPQPVGKFMMREELESEVDFEDDEEEEDFENHINLSKQNDNVHENEEDWDDIFQ